MTNHTIQEPQSRRLLNRILELPNLAKVVQSLEPGILHQLIRKCGLEDSGEIIALATTEQLMRVFDDDLWRSDRAGAEDQFDADRFGLWLEVLAEMGAGENNRRIRVHLPEKPDHLGSEFCRGPAPPAGGIRRGAPDHDCCPRGNAGMIVPSHFVLLAAAGAGRIDAPPGL